MKWMLMNEKHFKTVEIDEDIRWKRCDAIPRNISEREQDDCVVKWRKMNKTNVSKEGVL